LREVHDDDVVNNNSLLRSWVQLDAEKWEGEEGGSGRHCHSSVRVTRARNPK